MTNPTVPQRGLEVNRRPPAHRCMSPACVASHRGATCKACGVPITPFEAALAMCEACHREQMGAIDIPTAERWRERRRERVTA